MPICVFSWNRLACFLGGRAAKRENILEGALSALLERLFGYWTPLRDLWERFWGYYITTRSRALREKGPPCKLHVKLIVSFHLVSFVFTSLGFPMF